MSESHNSSESRSTSENSQESNANSMYPAHNPSESASSSENSQENTISDSQNLSESPSNSVSDSPSYLSYVPSEESVYTVASIPNPPHQERITDDTSESSDETPPSKRTRIAADIAGPSETNQPPPTFATFSCTLRPAKYLKLAAEALSDAEFNEQGFGRIDVDATGFTITVQNSSKNVVAHLRLNTLVFLSNKPMKRKMVRSCVLSTELAKVEDEATLYVNHYHNSDKLNFKLFDELPVDLLVNHGVIQKFPEISLFCEASVPSDDLKLMVQHLFQQQGPKQVSVDITKDIATLRAGSENPWEATYAILEVSGRRGMEAGQMHSATFHWNNVDWLNKASELEAQLLVRCHKEHPKCIILRFVFLDKGYLEYLKGTVP